MLFAFNTNSILNRSQGHVSGPALVKKTPNKGKFLPSFRTHHLRQAGQSGSILQTLTRQCNLPQNLLLTNATSYTLQIVCKTFGIRISPQNTKKCRMNEFLIMQIQQLLNRIDYTE